MPYIPLNRRQAIMIKDEIPKTAGELNYQLSMMIRMYYESKGESYQTYNDILGVLSAISHELYRRKIAPYEDKAIERNGDAF